MLNIEQTADELRKVAAEVRENVYAREAIARGFTLLACMMKPCEGGCEDCGSTQAAAVIDPADNPEAGRDVGTVAAGVIATTGQAMADNTNTGV